MNTTLYLKKLLLKHKFISIIFLIFLIPRVVSLGNDLYVADASKWNERSDRFVEAVINGDTTNTYQKYHPGVTLMYLSGFSKKLGYFAFETVAGYKPTITEGVVYPEHFTKFMFLAKFPLVLFISILLAYSSYLLLKLKLDKKFIIIYALVLSLEPFFWGISKYLHLSGLETGLFLATIFLTATNQLIKNSKKNLVLIGVLLGLSFLTKVSTVIILPFLGLELFILDYLKYKQKTDFYLRRQADSHQNDKINLLSNLKLPTSNFITLPTQTGLPSHFSLLTSSLFKSIYRFLFILTISAITFYALFPAMWSNPVEIINQIINEGFTQTAFVNVHTPAITGIKELFYFEKIITKTLGLTLVSLLLSFFVISKIKNTNLRILYVVCLLFTIYYLSILGIPSKQLERYYVNAIPFITFMSSLTLYYFYTNLKNLSKTIFIGGIIIYYLLVTYAFFPNMSAYISEFIGGYEGHSKLEVIENRGEFYYDVVKYLMKKDRGNSYNEVLRIYEPEKMRVMPGYTGKITHYDEAVETEIIRYRAPLFDRVTRVNKDNCKIIKTFGPKTPYKFDYIYLFECTK